MKISNKIWSIVLVVACLCAFASGYAWQNRYFHRSPEPRVNVFVMRESASGSDLISSGNLITNIGEQYCRDLLGYINSTVWNTTTCISVGNATAAVTLTKLTTEATAGGFTRANGTIAGGQDASTDHYFNATHTFTASATTNLNCVGLHWSGVSNSDSNLFACADIAATTFNALDNCTVTWQIIVNAN